MIPSRYVETQVCCCGVWQWDWYKNCKSCSQNDGKCLILGGLHWKLWFFLSYIAFLHIRPLQCFFYFWIIQYPCPYLQRNLWKNKATEEKESKDEGKEEDVEEKHWETHLNFPFTRIAFPSKTNYPFLFHIACKSCSLSLVSCFVPKLLIILFYSTNLTNLASLHCHLYCVSFQNS